MVDYLLKLGIEPDEPDYDKLTPFNLMSRSPQIANNDWLKTYHKLLKLDIRIDFPDIKERTPFLNFYE